MKTREKLSALRQLMKKSNLAAYIVPSTDPHQSEYVPDCWQRRAFLSGFTGSAGDLLVTHRGAGLWTDGRYFLQAEAQLDGSGITLFRLGEPDVPSMDTYLAATLSPGDRVGMDPRLLSVCRAAEFESALRICGAVPAYLEENLVDAIWKDGPTMPMSPVCVQPVSFAGETVRSKLTRLRTELARKGVEAHVMTALDAIAWLFNLRGRDVDHNPFVIAYALVTGKKAQLFVDPKKVTPSVRRELAGAVEILSYDGFKAAMASLSRRRTRVWVDPSTASRWVSDLLRGSEVVAEAGAVARMKARKNTTEIRGMRAAHIRDGVAMVRFLRWIEEKVPKGKVTEMSAAATLEEFRRQGKHFRGLSFATISAFGGNGAVVHYSADEASNAVLKPGNIYLIDSGGQYQDGTTDITRTLFLGKGPTAEQKDRFTRVLKGHIRLAAARFPEGVRGLRLDTLARQELWAAGLDYNHGTGHGVGAYLSVHEGPQAFSPTRCTGVALEEGNILSNEPGYYKAGAYGIRIENLVLVVRDKAFSRGDRVWLRLETITLCPIDTKLVDIRLLTDEERNWLNEYHRRVRRAISPRLSPMERSWLARACAPV